MARVEALVDRAPALAPLRPEQRAALAGCAHDRIFADGERIMREGDPADAFYVILEGAVALETDVPGRGAVVLHTLHDGELLGWSWLVPPYRTAFGARSTHVLAIDGACLRRRCEADPALGYALLKIVATVFVERLRDTRLRLLDVYGKAARG
jgi:CRP/FNR family transcriptional regulator, cyclic AMP receptor protein